MKEIVLFVSKGFASAFVPHRFSNAEDADLAKALARAKTFPDARDAVEQVVKTGGWFLPQWITEGVPDHDGDYDLIEVLEDHAGGVAYIKNLADGDIRVATPLDVVSVRKGGVIAVSVDDREISYY